MVEELKQINIVVAYPPLKGSILKAYNLQKLLVASFDTAVEMEEGSGKQLSVFLNGSEIYTRRIDENLSIDTEGIIEAICKCGILPKRAVKFEPEDEPENDPDHQQWLNSFCSGE